MFVIGNQVMHIAGKCAIRKLVIVFINIDQV